MCVRAPEHVGVRVPSCGYEVGYEEHHCWVWSRGAGLAQSLCQRRQAVIVVDQEATAFERLGTGFTGQTIVGAGLDREVLLQAGIERADGLAAVTGSDDTNVVLARLAASSSGCRA